MDYVFYFIAVVAVILSMFSGHLTAFLFGIMLGVSTYFGVPWWFLGVWAVVFLIADVGKVLVWAVAVPVLLVWGFFGWTRQKWRAFKERHPWIDKL